jgi:signal peptidase I
MRGEYTSKCIEVIGESLSDGTSLRFDAAGGSMTPLVPSGTQVAVEWVDVRELRFGDIILVRSNDSKLILHRFLGRISGGSELALITKGDNCLNFDEPVSQGCVLGRAATVGGRAIRGRLWNTVNKTVASFSLIQGSAYAMATGWSAYMPLTSVVPGWIRIALAGALIAITNPPLTLARIALRYGLSEGNLTDGGKSLKSGN